MSTEYENFDRQFRMAAGPAGGTGFEVGQTTDDQPVPLHVTFSLQKSDLETQNDGKIEIWNLNDEELAILNEEDCVVSMRAGYGDKLSLIFTGIVTYASTTMDSADRKTEIEVVDNLIEIRDTYISVSYSGTVNWKTIFDDVAAAMGVAVSYSYNATFTDVSNGYSFVGLARDIMTKGCDCCGLSWSLQNGVMQVKKTGDTMDKEVYVLSAETGLIGIPARVVVTEDEEEGNTLGWDVDIFLNGAINVDDYVYLESDVVTGYYRVYSIEYTGDNQASDWICSIRLLEAEEDE